MSKHRICARADCTKRIPLDRRICDEHRAPPGGRTEYIRHEWQLWYRKPGWKKRSRVFRAENPFCAECKRRGRVSLSTQTDHIIPHDGDENLFWDMKNLQALCDRCHGEKTRIEREGHHLHGYFSFGRDE